MFEYAVVGKGLIGSGAARYLSEQSDSVVVIGPNEPADMKLHNGVFASHYDSGRITRILDTEYVWALAAKRSIDRYRMIEEKSGIQFFHASGCLKVVPAGDWGLNYLAANEANGIKLGARAVRWDGAFLEQRLPFLSFYPKSNAIFEEDTGGWIDPRKLVQAQLTIAAKNGAQIVDETVVGASRSADGVELRTDRGQAYKAKTMLVAAGGFTNFNQLLPAKLNLTLHAETIVLAEISHALANEWEQMPSIILFLADRRPLSYVYIVPPVRYPDGRFYLKIGGDREADHVFDQLSDLQTWFQSEGGQVATAEFKGILQKLLPKLKAENWLSKPCLITDTVTQRPYIGAIDERTFVAVGGCGAAAKSSDEFGRLAALCASHQQADESYGKDAFSVVLTGEHHLPPRRKFHF
jgi:sarcosine oxidase